MVTGHLPLRLSIAIPTYGRESILLDTVRMLLEQDPAATEILVLDQTEAHERATKEQLTAWDEAERIRWIRLDQPSQPKALNAAIEHATQPLVLFLDDDIRVDPGFLKAHYEAFDSEAIWAVAGQVLQPGEREEVGYEHKPTPGPFCDASFVFRSAHKTFVQNGMSGNLCVRRDRALDVGGFDENFTPPVAYRFDNEFCKRLCLAGGRIVFEPKARIYHLRAKRGGTRTNSCHLTSISPEHGVGDYYFALRCAAGWHRWQYILRRPVREVLTKFHLRHPWWIPVKLLGEMRAFWQALNAYRKQPKIIEGREARS